MESGWVSACRRAGRVEWFRVEGLSISILGIAYCLLPTEYCPDGYRELNTEYCPDGYRELNTEGVRSRKTQIFDLLVFRACLPARQGFSKMQAFSEHKA